MDCQAQIFSRISGVRSASVAGNALTLYFADGASFRTETLAFRYALLHAKADFLPEAELLSGSNTLNFLSFFPDEVALDAAVGKLKEAAIPCYKWRDALGAAFFDQRLRLYQDLVFHDLRRLQLALAVEDGKFRAEVGDTSDWKTTITCASVREFLDEIMRVVAERDPDVIEGAELSSRTLPELVALAKKEKVAPIADAMEKAIAARQLPLEKFAKSEVLNDSPENYRKKLEAGSTRRSAAHELALASGRKFAAGDRVRFYVTGDKKKLPVVGNSRLLENAPEIHDENVPYYLEKFAALRAMFDPFTRD